MKLQRLSFSFAVAMLLLFNSCGKSYHHHDHEAETEHSDEAHADEIIFSQAQAKAAGLTLETVAPSDFSEVIKTSGQILSASGDEVTVAATSNGIVSYTSFALTDGSAVKQGQTLFHISAKNIVDGDPIAKAQLEYATAKKEFERAELLAKDKIVSARELEQARLRFETAKAAYQGISRGESAAGVGVSSSISGYIKSRLVRQGDYVSVGQPVAIVSQNKRLVLRAEVSERYFGQMKNIVSANFKTSYSDQLFQLRNLNGRLLSFGKSSTDDAYYLPVTFEFDNIGNILPGSFTEVYLLGNTRHQVISVPVSALTEEQGVNYVYLQLDAEGYRKQEVTLGLSNGDRTEILSGLKSGDKVVTKGAMQVKMASVGTVPEGHSH